MKKGMVKIFVILILLFSFVNCNAQDTGSIAYRIEPLKKGEVLDCENVIVEDEPNYTIVIYVVKDNARREIKKFKDSPSWPKLIDNDTKLFYMLENRDDRSGRDFAYLLNGKRGIAYFIGKISPSNDISNDGRYLCYGIDSKSKYIERLEDVYSKPGIVLEDLKTGKKQVYDFTNTFLKGDTWGAGVYVVYIPSKRVFNLSFSIENKIYSKGYISEMGGDYHEYTDVLYRGVVNSGDVHIRKEPSLEGAFITFAKGRPWILDKWDHVDIIDKTKVRVKISDHDDYWYKVRTFFGFEGWVYGAYLKILK